VTAKSAKPARVRATAPKPATGSARTGAGRVFAAFLRGVNVGGAKPVPMADLRAVVESLGHAGARTLLNSGNVVFRAKAAPAPAIAKALEAALAKRFGFEVPAVVVPADELRAIVREHAKAAAGREAARTLVAFAQAPAVLAPARPLLARDWTPEKLWLGRSTALLGCTSGIHASEMAKAFDRATKKATTTRNWATVLKLVALADEVEAGG